MGGDGWLLSGRGACDGGEPPLHLRVLKTATSLPTSLARNFFSPFPPSPPHPLQWYVDVALALLERAGDFCGEEIWHRVVQLVTNNADMQAYAAGQVGGRGWGGRFDCG